jgi:hypothetical protein
MFLRLQPLGVVDDEGWFQHNDDGGVLWLHGDNELNLYAPAAAPVLASKVSTSRSLDGVTSRSGRSRAGASRFVAGG